MSAWDPELNWAIHLARYDLDNTVLSNCEGVKSSTALRRASKTGRNSSTRNKKNGKP